MKIMDDDEKAAEGVFLNSKLDFKVVSDLDFLPENQEFFRVQNNFVYRKWKNKTECVEAKKGVKIRVMVEKLRIIMH